MFKSPTASANDDEIEEVEEELTAGEVLQRLEESWLNEKHSPELLGQYIVRAQQETTACYIQSQEWK